MHCLRKHKKRIKNISNKKESIMNKKSKNLIVTLTCIIIIYLLFLCVEHARFYNSLGSKPLITITQKEDEQQIAYWIE